MAEILQRGLDDPEFQLVLGLYGLPSDTQRDEVDPWIETHVQIVALFTDRDPKTGNIRTISRSRAAAIPVITARRQDQVWRARGELSREQILDEWLGNTPDRHGRHPDFLFDMAQMNFGHDGPITHIELSIMQRELERRQLVSAWSWAIRKYFERQQED